MNEDIQLVQKQLSVMQNVVAQCQRLVVEDGTLYILWGSLAVLASVLTYGAVWLNLSSWVVAGIWLVVFGVPGFIATYLKIQARKHRVVTFGEKIVIRLWQGVWIVLASVAMTGTLPGVPWQIISIIPFTFALVYFPLALLLDWKTLTVFALLWIATGLAMLFVPRLYSFIVLDAGIVVCEIVPGILIKRRAHRSSHTQSNT